MSRSLALLVALVSFSCSRTLPTSEQQRVAPKAVASAPSPVPGSKRVTSATSPSDIAVFASASASPEKDPEKPFRFPAAARVVAVGDLHGDLASTREALRLAGAIDDKDRWVGGKLVLVQVGDQLDRGDDEPEILRLLERLSEEATRGGGAVHVLNGNHELMNAVGDLRYVTPDGLHDYAAVPVSSTAHLPAGVPADARGRLAAFAPGSQLARKLAERNTITIVGDTVFAHAGVLSKHVQYGIGRINDEVRRFLRGETSSLPAVAASDDAPVWTRIYGAAQPSADACRELDAVLAALSVKRMVVGHTVQQEGITSGCEGRVYRVDVGLSDYYGANPTQVLELGPGGVQVLGEAPSPP